ncbi:hypothetical protein DFH08DRAFT_820984 [Mycena albidolilacea]|uniref:DUF6532 domain-containing protein n=1 Tax=Mycena albidolilacea TaxID=1033008 RepID=A0AAD7EE57_9AGAR|nr:hypothetical protein DFH08DRAFT_820984 [Mycena albidolilacea]
MSSGSRRLPAQSDSEDSSSEDSAAKAIQITIYGSQIQAKQVEAIHALLPTKYGFVRDTFKNIVKANKTKAVQLLKKATFHFKNPAERTGYAASTAISSIRELTSFKDKDTVGVLFPSRFNPINQSCRIWDRRVVSMRRISLPSIVLTLPALRGAAHVTPQLSKTSDANGIAVHRTETFVSSTLTATSTSIDDAQKEAMRDELAGRTGETDSKDENNIAAA